VTTAGWDYVAVFALTTLLALVLTPLALRFAVRKQVMDHPSEIKAQESPMPYLGGVAILVAFAVVVVLGAVIDPPTSGFEELVLILGLAVGLAIVGLLDDLRGLSPWLRLGLEVAAAVTVLATPVGVQLFDNDLLDLVVTVLWIVGVTNAFNLLDNMDGLSAGVSAVAAFFLFLVSHDSGQFLVATLAIALAGCALGFLRSNFPPARIYMGDAGALFIGFLLAVLSLKLETDAPPLTALFVPVLILGVPLFDTTLVTVNRLLHKRSPVIGGRDHTSHRLVFSGVPVPVAVGMIYAGAVSLGVMAFVVSRVDRTTGLLVFGWAAAIAITVGVALSMVPVYETSRRRRVMLRAVEDHEVEPLAGFGPVVEPDDGDQSGEPPPLPRTGST
jgi:UDP-GlcNAc:undecaprenyl-phosphate GlcNAc-1-phosphate transferase